MALSNRVREFEKQIAIAYLFCKSPDFIYTGKALTEILLQLDNLIIPYQFRILKKWRQRICLGSRTRPERAGSIGPSIAECGLRIADCGILLFSNPNFHFGFEN